MKTFLTPILLWTVIWYWGRIRLLVRKPYLLENAIFILVLTMTFLDCQFERLLPASLRFCPFNARLILVPLEWLSLWIRLPFMLLVSDIRQGIFYLMLFSFWVIFTGEHLTGDSSKNSLVMLHWFSLKIVYLKLEMSPFEEHE